MAPRTDRVVVSCHWGGSLAEVLTAAADIMNKQQPSRWQLEIRPRRVDWGKSKAAKFFTTYVLDTMDMLRALREGSVLVVATVGLPGWAVALVCRVLRRRSRLILLDPLLPRSTRFDPVLAMAAGGVDAFMIVRSGDSATLKRRCRVDPRDCHFIFFPAPTAIGSVARESDEGSFSYLYSAGEAHRDWLTLHEALKLTSCECVVASRSFPNLPDLPNLRLEGALSAADGRQRLVGAAALVMPFEDTTLACGPTVVVDALAAGVPIIASDSNACRDYVRDGETGLLYAPGQPADLADKIHMLIADETLGRSLASKGREFAADALTIERFATDLALVISRPTHKMG